MAVNIFVVVTLGKLSELAREAEFTCVVHTTNTPAVATPVTERASDAVEKWVVGIHGTAFAHGHVVRRIE
jgi:hypothetical protein